MMSDPNSPAARLRSLDRLLDYCLAEAHELGLDEVEQFLALASTSLEKRPKGLARKNARRKRSGAAGANVINLSEVRR
jgi:hypothetical protein